MDLANKKTAAIILAGGVGSRMRSEATKQFMELGGMTVLRRCVLAFDRCDAIDYIILVVRIDEVAFATSEMLGISKVKSIVTGGECRAASAICGLAAVDDDTQLIAIHDAARPLITPDMITRVVTAANTSGAATAASAVTDTIKRVDECHLVLETIPRNTLMRAQTPQVFDVSLYKRALSSYKGELSDITDDNMLLELIGVDIAVVDVGDENIKLTTPIDISLAELILRSRGDENV